MPKDSTKAGSNIFLGAEWYDSIEACVRTEIYGFIELILEAELSTALGCVRYARARARALAGREGIRARGIGCSDRTAGSWPQRVRLEPLASERCDQSSSVSRVCGT